MAGSHKGVVVDFSGGPITPTTGAEILDQVSAFISRYMKMSESQLVGVTLWTAHTYGVSAAPWTPYLAITSPEKRSGKTRLMETLEYLVHNPWTTSNGSAASLFRSIEDKRPTLFLDETDALFKGDKETAQAIRGILNAGAHYKGVVSRCVGKGTEIKNKDFSAFCPKAIGGIGTLPDTVADRSLPIRLKRKLPGEKVERLRERLIKPVAEPLRLKLEKWVLFQQADLEDAEPALPEELNDRQRDGAEPLLAIADAAGGDWPAKARKALIELYTGGAAQDDSIGVRLLADIWEIFGDEESIFSRDLVRALNEKETSPWGEWGKTEKGLTQHSLASKLKPFEIEPKKIRIGEATGRGYLRADFTDAWERYLNLSPDPVKPPNPPPPVSGVEQPAQRSNDAGKTHFSGVEHDLSVPLRKSEESPMFTRVVPLVPLEKPGEGEGGARKPGAGGGDGYFSTSRDVDRFEKGAETAAARPESHSEGDAEDEDGYKEVL